MQLVHEIHSKTSKAFSITTNGSVRGVVLIKDFKGSCNIVFTEIVDQIQSKVIQPNLADNQTYTELMRLTKLTISTSSMDVSSLVIDAILTQLFGTQLQLF